ncbi:MAG: hypothetical protein NZ899_12960 [Thermoguttaceae bacterium]|nr:hypothetical protein [Thermoguttaceae bacterium]MDW8079980.1 hypothetical protein [Thermoguttaceae bacterium]
MRRVTVVVLCEDQQHEVFARRFLKKLGVGPRDLRIVGIVPGKQSAEQFVRENFLKELRDYRRMAARKATALVVLMDGNTHGPAERQRQLREACSGHGVEWIRPREKVLLAFPTYRIENWFSYLDGKEVPEHERCPRLKNPSDCQRHVDQLWEICQSRQLPADMPESSRRVCVRFDRQSWRDMSKS